MRKLTRIPEIHCPDCGEKFNEPHAHLVEGVGSVTECYFCEAQLVCVRMERGGIWMWAEQEDDDAK